MVDKQTIKRAAEYVIERLKSASCKVMRYDSYSTNSVYLKIDDGVAGTLRISDHKGKKHLKYTYNLVAGVKFEKKVEKGVPRYFAPFTYIVELVDKILLDRSKRIQDYGERYELFMKMNRERGAKQKGFWKQAKYV